MTAVFILLVLFQLKHFFADYPLQRPWMLGKFLEKGWVAPLAAHCLVHAAMTFVIVIGCAVFSPINVWCLLLPVFDFVAHFIMDRVKASKKLLGRFEPLNKYSYPAMEAAANGNPIGAPYPVEEAKARLRSNRWFWHSLGIDQMVHHLTHYVIILVLYLCMLH